MPSASSPPTEQVALHLPYDVQALRAFFAARQVAGVETTTDTHAEGAPGWALRRSVQLSAAGQRCSGWIEAWFDARQPQVRLRCAPALAPVWPAVRARLRTLLDLERDPAPIAAVLHADFPAGDGLRVPGTWDGFELAVRAVLGQQVTVAAARTLTARLVAALGAPLATPWPEIDRLFPTPEALATADADRLGRLGLVRQRQRALQALAHAVAGGTLVLAPGADPHAAMAALRRLPGIGDWTAQYVALRALGWADAFPSGDVALHKALGLQGTPAQRQRAALARAETWRPWRGYATLRAWASAPQKP